MLADDIKLPMSVVEIQKYLPHRYPLLLVDRILDLKAGEYIKATKCISISDPILQGHFPDNPVFPGVLIVEGVAQAAGVLGYVSQDDGFSSCLLTEISKTRFRHPVVPGDVLTYDIHVVKRKAGFFWFEASALVDGKQVAKIELSALIK